MTVTQAGVETMPSQEPARSSPIDILTKHFLDKMGLKDEHSASLHAIMNRAFTERLENEDIHKTNSLAFLLRALQLEEPPFLPTDPTEMRQVLERAWIGSADVNNLKMINDENNEIGGSFKAGNQVVILHEQSIAGADFGPDVRVVLIRPQGDEFFFLAIPKDGDIAEELIKTKITEKTEELINQIVNSPEDHPLKAIAQNHRELIGKSLVFGHLVDLQLPQGVKRMDDMTEWLLSETEEMEKRSADPNEPPSASKMYLKKLEVPSLAPRKPDLNGLAIDQIIKAVEQTTKVSDYEANPENQVKRMKTINRYCPASLMPALDELRRLTADNPQANALLLTITEEALFNNQFSRESPILNEWCFDEITRNTIDGPVYQYEYLGMASTFFLKLINTFEGRIAGTRILRNLADTLTRAIPKEEENVTRGRPDILVKKSGGSFYYAARNQDVLETYQNKIRSSSRRRFPNQADLEKTIADLNSTYQDAPSRLSRLMYLIASQFVVAGAVRMSISHARQHVRSDQYWGAKSDEIRNKHYLAETTQAINLAQEFDQLAGIKDLWRAFMAERPSRRYTDLVKLKKAMQGQFESYFMQLFQASR